MSDYEQKFDLSFIGQVRAADADKHILVWTGTTKSSSGWLACSDLLRELSGNDSVVKGYFRRPVPGDILMATARFAGRPVTGIFLVEEAMDGLSLKPVYTYPKFDCPGTATQIRNTLFRSIQSRRAVPPLTKSSKPVIVAIGGKTAEEGEGVVLRPGQPG